MFAKASLATFVALADPGLSPAKAAPNGPISCPLYTYYSSPQMTHIVGIYGACPGGDVTGKGEKTRWFRVKSVPMGPPNPVTGKPGGFLPCEFLAAGCSNLPVQ